MKPIPDFITHYSRGIPFRSMSGISPSELDAAVSSLNEENIWGKARFSDPEYLQRRKVVESSLRDQFFRLGGQPELNHPIYLFLGRNPRFEEHSGNRGYMISLKDLPPGSVSFTYGDSLLGFDEVYRRQSGEKYQHELVRRLFTLDSVSEIFSSASFPKDPLHVEVQLWVNPELRIVRNI